MRIFIFALFMIFHGTACATSKMLVIGHRGASGYLPEHTLASYKLAIDQGADFIEPDLVSTKDGVLVARHENNIADTTDVELKFPERKTTKTIDGEKMTGYFTEDFTLAELKTLRAKERLPFRNHENDFKFEIPTFAEVIDLAAARGVGVYPELKHPSYFRSIGLALEPKLVAEINKRGLNSEAAPVIVQSFELSSLAALRPLLRVRLVFLIDEAGKRPYDHVLAGDPRTYGDMIKADSLAQLASLIFGIGPWKRLIVPEANGVLLEPTSLVKDAHAAGLKVHAYTFRSDKEYLHAIYNGDPSEEYRQFRKLGVDGVFSDFPDHAVKALGK